MNFKNGLILPALIFSIAVIVCASMLVVPLKDFVTAKKSIAVTGSAKKQIKSDLADWRGSFSRQAPDLSTAYAEIKSDMTKVNSYLLGKGIDQNAIQFTPVFTETLYGGDYQKGLQNEIVGYRLRQTVTVKSSDLDKITTLSREAPELINQGVVFQSNPPQYYFTKLNDLKIDMLADAAKDAAMRAEKMASASGSKVGHLRAARMGVFQITPLNSNEVSDYGINDTSSIDKEITAVVNAEFSLE